MCIRQLQRQNAVFKYDGSRFQYMSHEIGGPCILAGFVSERMDININAAIDFCLGENICFAEVFHDG